ncbi:AroM family protein [Roseomonas sp. OT10]|uniref:AroM family protein n=1 Tax=Roseomonas cutis TaxID=2897332 RepID=UPI001E47DE29|nr:AroM family protein [Roseomonas sp. OT10]UFN49738.1 AroM family protein [Roseomonas sp. OT10]
MLDAPTTNTTATLRVLVIGQSPRPEIEEQFALAVPGMRIAVEGALDGMTREEIARDAAPRSDADTLFTVLPSGETTKISKAVVTEKLVGKLGVPGPTLLNCTGAFKGLPERADLVQPSAVLEGLTAALLPKGRLGLLVPVPEQVESLTAKRARPGLEVVAMPLQPLSDEATIEAAGRAMAAHKPDLLVLDCMSYTAADKAILGPIVGCPVLVSIEVAARAAACLLPA